MVKAFSLPGMDGDEEPEEREEAATAGGSSEEDGDEEEDATPFTQLEVDDIQNNLAEMIALHITKTLHLRCPIHLLQLAIKDALKDHENINRLLTKVGGIVTSIRKSTLNTEEADLLGVRPGSACPTRWNSQLDTIQSLLRLFQKDPAWQTKMKLKSQLTLNEVRQLNLLVEVLTPLADLTQCMQKELGNLGIILPAVMEI